MTNTPRLPDLPARPDDEDPRAAYRYGRAHGELLKAAAADARRLELGAGLYDALGERGYLAAVDTVAGDWTVIGWRFAGLLAELGGNDTVALEYRRRALEVAGQSRDLDPTSLGFLLTVYPPIVDHHGDDVAVYCTVPTTKAGEPCTWRQVRPELAAYTAHEDHMRHMIREHATTGHRADVVATGGQPGDDF